MADEENWFESRARRNLIRFMCGCFAVAILGHTVALIAALAR